MVVNIARHDTNREVPGRTLPDRWYLVTSHEIARIQRDLGYLKQPDCRHCQNHVRDIARIIRIIEERQT
ncbi:MAG: hypothetical protein LUQ31_02080 [Methanoregula sp.]|nr:hypothetical protein [Methanoregula sp.]